MILVSLRHGLKGDKQPGHRLPQITQITQKIQMTQIYNGWRRHINHRQLLTCIYLCSSV